MECAALAIFTPRDDPEKFSRLKPANHGDTASPGITVVSLQGNEYIGTSNSMDGTHYSTSAEVIIFGSSAYEHYQGK
jgi:hypothetical protein